MAAQSFANFSKSAPVPASAIHTDGNPVRYTCHMAVMHWAFRELGDNDATANKRIVAITHKKCEGCLGNVSHHGSIDAEWYGDQLVGKSNNIVIVNRGALYSSVNIGDILVTSAPERPMHSMVVVSKSTSIMGGTSVKVRGFNNVGTLGTGRHLTYDNHDREIDKARYWHTQGRATRFGQGFAGGSQLYCIPFAKFIGNAGTVRANCSNSTGAWRYLGP